MSRTETYDEAYRDNVEGYSEYIGKCSLHQDYENKKFKMTTVILDSVEPRDLSDSEYERIVKSVGKELVTAFEVEGNMVAMKDTDDFSFDKIESTIFPNLDLYHGNIGVGGGNGIHIVLNKLIVNGVVKYELMSSIMDGDVEYCDSKVWTK